MKFTHTKRLINKLIEKERRLDMGAPINDSEINKVQKELNFSQSSHFYKNMIIFVLALINIVLWMCI